MHSRKTRINFLAHLIWLGDHLQLVAERVAEVDV